MMLDKYVFFVCVIQVVLDGVVCDYSCVCNYNVELTVFNSVKEKAKIIGYLYEFDCKPQVFVDKLDGKWLAVAFEKQLGYVQKDAQIQVQTCPGNQPEEDKLTTTSRPTTVQTTTHLSTTHSATLETTRAAMTSVASVDVDTTSSKASLVSSMNSTLVTSTVSVTSTVAVSSTPVRSTVSVSSTNTKTSETLTSTNASTLPSQHVTGYTSINISSKPQSTLTSYITNNSAPSSPMITLLSTMTTPSSFGRTPSSPDTRPSSPDTRSSSPDTMPYSLGTTPSSSMTTPNNYTSANYIIPNHTSTIRQTSLLSSVSSIRSVNSQITTSVSPPFPSTLSTGKALSVHPLTSPTNMFHTTTHIKLSPVVLRGAVSKCRGNSLLGHFNSQFGRYCYELATGFNRRPWKFSELYCKLQGGHLLSITSAAEEEYMYQLLLWRNVTEPVWTGLNDQKCEEIFQWSSGEPVTYFDQNNWKGGRKGSDYFNEDCVLLDPVVYPGVWDDVNCNSSHAFVCKYKVNEVSSITQLPQTSPGTQSFYTACQPRYYGLVTQLGSHCFEFVRRNVTWFKASDICNKEGGRLAEILNLKEQSQLINFTHDNDIKERMWIGLQDLETNHHFQWNNGQNLASFMNWQSSPSSSHDNPGIRECVVMLPSGKWSAINCFPEMNYPVHHPFLCEYGEQCGCTYK